MKIIPFGTNGFFPSFGRATACYVIPFKDKLIVLDAGSGLFRFAEPQGKRLLRRVNEIHLFLSHYHLDHTFGFYAAFKLFEGKQVRVFSQSERQVFWEFVTLAHFPVNYEKVHKNFQWNELKLGKNTISDYEVSIRKQYHRGEGSLAFKLKFKEGEIAYITDSEPTKESAAFVKKVPLLLHEHEISPKDNLNNKRVILEKLINDGHVTTAGAALIAKEAKVKKLALIHHNPFIDNNQLKGQLQPARSIFPNTFLARDLEEIQF